jgi:hypothetical protein
MANGFIQANTVHVNDSIVWTDSAKKNIANEIIKKEDNGEIKVAAQTCNKTTCGQDTNVVKKVTKSIIGATYGATVWSRDSLYKDSLRRQKDLRDVFHSILGIKEKPIDSSKIKMRKLHLAVSPYVKYNVREGGVASLTFNATFYTADTGYSHFSSVKLTGPYSLEKQLILDAVTNIWTKNGNYNFLGDWRYSNYPTFTYGLGSNTSVNRRDSISYYYVKFHEEVLRRLGAFSYFGVGYYYDKFYNIVDNENQTNFQEYNEYATQTVSSGPVLRLMYDSRGNLNNPQKGFYGSIIYRDNMKMLGSDDNWQSVNLELRKYFRVGKQHNVLAFWVWNEATFGGKPPYLDLPSTGSNDYLTSGRGYAPGRFTGTQMAYGEGEFRFAITKNGLLGGVIFANGETQSALTNITAITNVFSSVVPADGVGLRIKFNKQSNVNLCLDYAVGRDGSGFFFNLGEVF